MESSDTPLPDTPSPLLPAAPTERPKRILLFGILFIMCGGKAALDMLFMVYSWFTPHAALKFNFNAAIFMLPVGIGLLKGKKSSLWWSHFWIMLFLVIFGIVLLFFPIIAFVKPDDIVPIKITSFEITSFGGSRMVPVSKWMLVFWVSFVDILLLMALGWARWLLRSPKAVAWCWK